MKLTNHVPRTVILFGVHLRFQFAGQYYSRGIPETLRVAVPFCQSQLQKEPTALALCTDNKELFDRFKKHFPVISAPVIRAPDADHVTALTDLVLLLICDEWLLSHRSTFSAVVCFRNARRGYIIEKYASSVWLMSNSQVAIQLTPLFLAMPAWKMFEANCMALTLSHAQLEAARYYFKYLVV
jgi:hypothetical protein